MSTDAYVRSPKRWKGEQVGDRLMQPAAGIEAEFSLLVDDVVARPEEVFGDPRGFVTVPLMHRTGRSFHLPNGAAIYFDTGVIEIASPAMELESGCFGRLARSMEVAIAFVRQQLDGWEQRAGRRARLQGFSTHYNVSIADEGTHQAPSQRIKDMAWLLVHVLPAPVMLLGTNRHSTGVGVRPRVRRIEVTADFPPDTGRLAATGTVIAGVVSAVSHWRDLRVDALRRRRVPVIKGFRPIRHTSRRGWLAGMDCYPENPFACTLDMELWATTLGCLSLREMAWQTFVAFREPIRRLADPFSYRILSGILSGASPSWLDEAHRPAEYDDVGRGTFVPEELNTLGLARYERVLLNAIAAKPLQLQDERWIPVGVRGWSRVVFRRERDGAQTTLPLDALVSRLEDWERH
jgi:hypothetical protein